MIERTPSSLDIEDETIIHVIEENNIHEILPIDPLLEDIEDIIITRSINKVSRVGLVCISASSGIGTIFSLLSFSQTGNMAFLFLSALTTGMCSCTLLAYILSTDMVNFKKRY